ncbi:MAG: flagellar export chaperone FlgN [Gemmatimonadaceae bacterium]
MKPYAELTDPPMMPNENSTRAANRQPAQQRWLVGHLLDAIRTEQRLLQDLGRLMQQQRAAIAAEDHEGLDDATFGIQRILQTLGEASRRPRIINRQLGGAENMPVSDLAESLGVVPPQQLLTAQNDLREAARLLEDEVRTNRALLTEALRSET